MAHCRMGHCPPVGSSDLVPADVQEKYLGYIDEMIRDTFMT
ncbi:MAG: hypothetical protein ACLUEU_09805 [Oscillospiraceae bacterium]